MITPIDLGATLRSTFLLNTVKTQLEQWLDPYLNLTWWMGHPLISAITIVLLLVIAQAVLGLFSYLIKQLLIWLVKSPYLIFQWGLSRASLTLKLPVPKRFLAKAQATATPNSSTTVHEQLLTLLQKLETSRQAQDQLLSELQDVLKTDQESTLLINKSNLDRESQLPT